MTSKKILVIATIVLTCFLFTACGQSEESKAVDAQISAVTEVTLDDKQVLDNLDSAVASLSEEDRNALQNIEKLDELHAQYDQAVFDEEVSKVEEKINGIGEVTTRSSLTIKDARANYDKASPEVQNAVSNYDVLTKAEEELVRLEEEEKAKHAQAVMDSINDLNTAEISLEDSNKIANVRREYTKLTSEEKNLVTNLADLEKAEDSIVEIQKACMENTQHNRDDYKDADFYLCSSFPRYLNDRTFILPYVAKQGSTVQMRAHFNYAGREWIFWDTIYIVTDNNRYTITAASYDINRDVIGAHDLLESYDKTLTDQDIEMFRDIAYSDSANAKFTGQWAEEYEISEKDRLSMRDVLATYDYLSTHK